MFPMDYQYYLSAWIYKVLRKADMDFAAFLHEKGYGEGEIKLYKLFCFSLLDFGRPKMWKEKRLFEISEHTIILKISFDVPEAASNFIKGLFMEQEFYLGDKFNGIDFKITGIEALPDPVFSETMHYRLETPWVVSYKTEVDKYPKYLRPYEVGFKELSLKHIAEKFTNTGKGNVKVDDLNFRIFDGNDQDKKPIFREPEPAKWLEDSKFWKRQGFLIKPGTKEESRVLGNLFDFELTAPTEVHKMIWNAGISEKSSEGFGWLEVCG
jgi:CRISPR-associated endoribonuclease Cas6